MDDSSWLNPRFRWGLNLFSLLALCCCMAMPTILVASFAGVTGIALDAMLIASQIACAILAALGMAVATHTHRRMIDVFEMKEVEARLRDVEKITTIDWKPGTILWVSLDVNKKQLQSVATPIKDYFEEKLGVAPPVLITSRDCDLKAISVVDMLGLLGRVVEEPEDES